MGFKDVSLNQIVQFKVMDISKGYIEELRKAGYPDLSLNQVVQCKVMGIDQNLIKKATEINDGKLMKFNKLIMFAASLDNRP